MIGEQSVPRQRRQLLALRGSGSSKGAILSIREPDFHLPMARSSSRLVLLFHRDVRTEGPRVLKSRLTLAGVNPNIKR
jgi:hypothetical protein